MGSTADFVLAADNIAVFLIAVFLFGFFCLALQLAVNNWFTFLFCTDDWRDWYIFSPRLVTRPPASAMEIAAFAAPPLFGFVSFS